MDSGRAAAVFRECYLQPLFIYDGFIMLSPSWIILSPAKYCTMLHTLLYSTTEVNHTVHPAVLEKPKEAAVYTAATQRKWKTSKNYVCAA